MTNALFNFLSAKYATGEASLDNFEAYLSFYASNDTLPRAPFTVCWIEAVLLILYRQTASLGMDFSGMRL
jgi:hypothetical protein